MTDASKQITVTLIKSTAGSKRHRRDCVRGLGLRRMHHTVTVADTPENRGMINRVTDMLEIKEGSQ